MKIEGANMPLIKEITVDANTQIGIWKVDEDIADLKWMLQWGADDIKKFQSINDNQRILHWLGSRVLLRKMLNTSKFIDLQVDEYGKPFLGNVDKQLSISHSGELVAVMLSDKKCGIDLQHIEKRIDKLAHKFISEEEMEDLDEPFIDEKMYLFWCGKEALYKLYGKRKLDFKTNLHIFPFDWHPPGKAIGEIKKDGFFKTLTVNYQIVDGYLLAYAIDAPKKVLS